VPQHRKLPAQPFLPAPPVVFRDGAPVVDGLEVDEILGAGDVPYMARHYLRRGYDWAVQFHHLLTDDPDPDLHDHPWDFTSLLLTGGYREYSPDGAVEFRAPCVVSRRAESPHRLELLDGPMWTLVSAGPVRRRWGFHTARGWVPWREYRSSAVLVSSRVW
jgi:hypothetical protein